MRVGYPWWLRPWMSRTIVGITLGRRIYLRPGIDVMAPMYFERLMRHELAHVRQVNRYGLLRFLTMYLSEFIVHAWQLRSFSRAYETISFEREATAAEGRYNPD